MSTTVNASRSKMLWVAVAVAAVAVVVGGGLWLSLDNDSAESGSPTDYSADPYRNAVSDDRAPKMTVTVREDDGKPVADIAYDAPSTQIPDRGTTVYLQTLNADTWSTAYSLSNNRDEVIEGISEDVDLSAVGGPGPDTYLLPDLNPDTTYRICVPFVIDRQGSGVVGCSDPFPNS